MLSRYLCCKERFRLYAMDGLRTVDEFNHRIEYGNLWHTVEEAVGKGKDWQIELKAHAEKLMDKYRTQKDEIYKWYRVCHTQFPIYLKHWVQNTQEKAAKPVFAEQVFRVPYRLPSRRIVQLRGKWDGGVLAPNDAGEVGLWLNEHKTKGDIKPDQLQRQLTFDLQTMMYVVALREPVPGSIHAKRSEPIMGVRYNVVRRPLSGGKGSIVKHKPTKSNPQGESDEQYYARLGQYIKDEPDHYFMRWNISIGKPDVERFKTQCLVPILENVCDDYEWWDVCWKDNIPVFDIDTRERRFPDHSYRHFVTPYGVYNPLLEGGTGDLDDYMQTGSETGLRRVTELFEELR